MDRTEQRGYTDRRLYESLSSGGLSGKINAGRQTFGYWGLKLRLCIPQIPITSTSTDFTSQNQYHAVRNVLFH